MPSSSHSAVTGKDVLIKLLDLGQDVEEEILLENYLDQLEWDDLNLALSLLFDKKKKCDIAAPDVVHCLYQGMKGPLLQEKRIQTTLALLRHLRESDHLSSNTRNNVMYKLALALESASADELVSAADDLVDSIKNRNDPNTGWKSALPKILELVAKCPQVSKDEEFMTGLEYYKCTISTLLEMDWSVDLLPTLALMFADMRASLASNRVVLKFCAAIPTLPPNEVVTLVQSVLLLGHYRGIYLLFLELARYFDKWVYSGTQATTDQTRRWLRDAPGAEATLRLCVLDAARAGGLRKLPTTVANMAACPELVLSPFMLATLLALSHLRNYQKVCLKAVVDAVVKAIEEQRLRGTSAWVRGLTSAPVQLERAFTLVIDHNYESERVLRGVLAVAVQLLESPQSRVPPLGAAICAVARAALVAVVRRRPREMSPVVLEELFERSRANLNGSQFVECVRCVVSASPESVSCSENVLRSALANISCHALGSKLVRALAPVLGPSAVGENTSALRESLIIVLRKDLASNKLQTRCNAVSSLLHLLRGLAVKDLAAISSSQCSQMMPSTSRQTQAVSQRGFSATEATCMDLLRVLTRCFGQQVAVRYALYHGLGRSACRNPELLGYVHIMLLGQLGSYLAPDGEEIPLRFSECFDSTKALKEPLGHLLLACAQAVARGSDGDGCGKRLRAKLDSLVDRLPKCQPTEIGQISAISEVQRQIMSQFRDCLDALLVHVMLSDARSGDKVTPDIATKLDSLIEARETYTDFIKPGARAKGKGRKGKAKSGTQLEEEPKKGKTPAVVPKSEDPVFDEKATLILLNVAFRDDGGSELYRRAALWFCRAFLTTESVADLPAFPARACSSLWAFIGRERAMASDSFVPALNLVTELTVFVADSWPDKLGAFFEKVGGGLEPMLETLRVRLDDEPAEDVEPALLRALAALAAHGDAEQPYLAQLLAWLEGHLASHDPTENSVAVLALVLTLRRRVRSVPALDAGIAQQLLHLLGVAEYHRGVEGAFKRLRMLSVDCAGAALVESCGCVRGTLSEAVWFAERLHSEQFVITGPADSTAASRRERAMCLHVGHLVKPVQALVGALPSAKSQRALAMLLKEFYMCNTRLAKHFLARSEVDMRAIEQAQFDVLVKLTGGAFSEAVAGFILAAQNAQEDGKLGKAPANNLLPAVTFQKETMERFLIRLSKAVKTNLMQFVKVNGARDFRLKKTLLLGEENEQPRANTSRENASKADTSKADTSKADTSKADTSIRDTSKRDTSKLDSSRLVTSKADASKADVSNADISKGNATESDASDKDSSDGDNEAPPPKRAKKSRP